MALTVQPHTTYLLRSLFITFQRVCRDLRPDKHTFKPTLCRIVYPRRMQQISQKLPEASDRQLVSSTFLLLLDFFFSFCAMARAVVSGSQPSASSFMGSGSSSVLSAGTGRSTRSHTLDLRGGRE